MTINERIRRQRLRKGLTLQQLGAACGLTKGYLSKLERGKQAPPVSTLQTLALALEVDVTELLEREPDADGSGANLDVVRKGSPWTAGRADAKSRTGYSWRPLLNHFRNKYMSPFLVKVPKGRTETFTHDSEELIFVVRGEVELHYEGKTHRLGEEDSAYCDSRKPHYFVNRRKQDAVLVTVNYNYRRF